MKVQVRETSTVPEPQPHEHMTFDHIADTWLFGKRTFKVFNF